MGLIETIKILLATVTAANRDAMAPEIMKTLENPTADNSIAVFDKHCAALRYGCNFHKSACGPSFGACALYKHAVKYKERNAAANKSGGSGSKASGSSGTTTGSSNKVSGGGSKTSASKESK